MNRYIKLIFQLLRFSAVGITAYIIDYLLMLLLTEVFGITYIVSVTLSYTISTVYNYALSMRYVYGHKDEMSKRSEFVIFIVLSLVGLGFNDLLMWVGTSLVGIDYRISKLLVGIVVSGWNFVSRKVFLDSGGQPVGVKRITDGRKDRRR